MVSMLTKDNTRFSKRNNGIELFIFFKGFGNHFVYKIYENNKLTDRKTIKLNQGKINEFVCFKVLNIGKNSWSYKIIEKGEK